MKRNLIAVTAILLTLVMLAGCAEPASTDLNRGTINGSIYTSDFTELTFTAPENWGYLADYKLDRYLWSSDMSFDMFACNSSRTDIWVCVSYADLAAAGKTDCSEETYFELDKEKLKEGKTEDAFSHYEFSDYTDVKVGSNSFKTMSIKNANYDFSHYFYVRRKDDYMIFIFVQIPNDLNIDSVMANFS